MFKLKFLFNERIFEQTLLIFLIFFIFNFAIIEKLYLVIFFVLYSSIFFFFNFLEFKDFKKLWIIYPLLIYIIIYILFENLILNSFKIGIKSSLEIFFNIFLFSLIYLQKKNWKNFYKKLNIFISLIILYIFFQNFILLENYFITSDIFFSINKYEYNLASKNFLAIILNILLVSVISDLKRKINFIILVIFSTAIILTFSRSGLYLLIANFFISLILVKEKKYKLIFLILLLFSSTFFWNEKMRSFYIENKKNIVLKYSPTNHGENPSIFTFSWFKITSSSSRPQYYFKTLENLSKNPIFGTGLGSFKLNNKVFNDNFEVKRFPDPHSTILLILYELGLLGMIFFLILFIKCIKLIFYSKPTILNTNLYFFTIIIFSSLLINMFYSPLLWFLIATSYWNKNE